MQPLNKKCHLEITSVMVVWREMTSCFHFSLFVGLVGCFTPSYGQQRSGAAVRATRPWDDLILRPVCYPLCSLAGLNSKAVAALDVFFLLWRMILDSSSVFVGERGNAMSLVPGTLALKQMGKIIIYGHGLG